MTKYYETVVVESVGFNLSRIIWRRFKKPMAGLLEETLAANINLAALGPVLPVGTTFRLPIPDQAKLKNILPIVRLWD
jgi:phage tail protein X